MGHHHSKTVTYQHADGDQTFSTQSGGVHLFEVHMGTVKATAGVTTFVILLLIGLCIFGGWITRWWLRYRKRRAQLKSSVVYTQPSMPSAPPCLHQLELGPRRERCASTASSHAYAAPVPDKDHIRREVEKHIARIRARDEGVVIP